MSPSVSPDPEPRANKEGEEYASEGLQHKLSNCLITARLRLNWHSRLDEMAHMPEILI